MLGVKFGTFVGCKCTGCAYSGCLDGIARDWTISCLFTIPELFAPNGQGCSTNRSDDLLVSRQRPAAWLDLLFCVHHALMAVTIVQVAI
jgi:hypothetical protein